MDERIKALEECFGFIENVVEKHNVINFFFSNIDIPLKEIKSIKDNRHERLLETCWMNMLIDLNKKYNNFYIIDLKLLIENNGRKIFYSEKLWYLGGMKYSLEAVTIFSDEIERIIKSVKGKKKKCLILDLDNTLWGGIIGEDGIENIELSEFKEGARYKDFQKRLKEIKEIGVILAIVSKNNHEDAIDVFKNHKHMVLQESDFVSLKINWKHKIQNIRELSEELNIGLDSFVFIDDNPFERESVINQLPEVFVPEFPKDTAKLEQFVINLYNDHFLTLLSTNEDKKKTQMYRQNVKRVSALKSTDSLDDFLKTLKTEIEISKIKNDDITRVAQLTQKTNQFNLTTRRYTEKDIKAFMESDNHDIFVISVKDKFGDNGTVSVIILNKNDETTLEIDTFLMSCRVMERKIEDQVLGVIENRSLADGYRYINAYYIPTEKNRPVETLFERLGYTLMDKDDKGYKKYRLALSQKPERCAFAETIEKIITKEYHGNNKK